MPIISPTQKMRKKRIKLVLNIIKKHKEDGIELKKLISLLSLNYGFSKDLTEKYIEDLKDAEFIEIKDGVIKCRKKS